MFGKVLFKKLLWCLCFFAALNETQSSSDAVAEDEEDENNSTSGKALSKKKAHLKKFFKEEQDKSNKKKHGDEKLTIPAGGRADTVDLEELQKQASSKKKVRKTDYSESDGQFTHLLDNVVRIMR